MMRERIKQWEDYGLRKVANRYPMFTFLECGFLWELFSEENYCAGFLNISDEYLSEFDALIRVEFWEWFLKAEIKPII